MMYSKLVETYFLNEFFATALMFTYCRYKYIDVKHIMHAIYHHENLKSQHVVYLQSNKLLI